MSTCPICGSSFDEHGYQLVIYGLGSFDSIECFDEALRRQARARRKLSLAALDATAPSDESPSEGSPKPGPKDRVAYPDR